MRKVLSVERSKLLSDYHKHTNTHISLINRIFNNFNVLISTNWILSISYVLRSSLNLLPVTMNIEKFE